MPASPPKSTSGGSEDSLVSYSNHAAAEVARYYLSIIEAHIGTDNAYFGMVEGVANLVTAISGSAGSDPEPKNEVVPLADLFGAEQEAEPITMTADQFADMGLADSSVLHNKK